MNKQTSDFQAVSSTTVQSPILPTQNILGVEVADLSLDEALKFTHGRLALELFTPITFLNAHNGNIAQRDIHFVDVLDDFTVFPDGIGVDIASKILYGAKFKANLNGTDFIPALFRSAPRRLKVALYGARPGIAKRAADAFAEMDDRHVYRSVGHGFTGAKKQAAILDEILKWRPDVVLVAKGVPAQELWIHRHLTEGHCTLAFGVGALFDFTAGNVARAPNWMRAIRAEWIYRLAQEPARMWRRYILGNPVFLIHVIKQKLGWSPERKVT